MFWKSFMYVFVGFCLSVFVEDRKYGYGRNSDGDKNYVIIFWLW